MARIVTLTLNPAIDLAWDVPRVRPQEKLRVGDLAEDPGGGGVNVARVLHQLGARTCAVVLAGGVAGGMLAERMDAERVPYLVVPIAGRTRISLTVHETETRLEYRFVPPGPVVTEAEFAAALEALVAEKPDWVIASGSLPPGLPLDAYARVAQRVKATGARFVLDSSGAPLAAALGQGVALIKPSLDELEALVGESLAEEPAQEAALRRLIGAGAVDAIALTLGAKGAIWADRDRILRRRALVVEPRSEVGAGDSFLAGLVHALAGGAAPDDALAWGLAAGAAAVMQLGTTHPHRADIVRLYADIMTRPA